MNWNCVLYLLITAQCLWGFLAWALLNVLNYFICMAVEALSIILKFLREYINTKTIDFTLTRMAADHIFIYVYWEDNFNYSDTVHRYTQNAKDETNDWILLIIFYVVEGYFN